MTLGDALSTRTAARDLDAAGVQLLHFDDDDATLRALLDTGAVYEVVDTLVEQVRGLLETRDPGLLGDALAQAVAHHIGDSPDRYGVWVFYPWSGRLVHTLPEDEFRELRTSRNRNKITEAEQERLRALRIGIVGLSIGQAAAVTLTLEEVGGFLALADFDHLELSNLNRLRAGIHGLGVNKAVLAAREVLEINPYARLALFRDGITDDNIDAFLTHGGRPLDLVYEECDDLHSKILVRERARHHGIPVLMETSDRGLMDIERFDLDPERPLFHGLAGDVKAEGLKDLTNYEKVPLVMRIIGRDAMSARMAASMVDIDASLKGWPQLASEVALGAGINVDTARRIALGELTCSGRFYVDIAQVISDDAADLPAAPPPLEIEVSPQALRLELPELSRPGGAPAEDDIRALVAWATTAFSGGNAQPWTFHWRPGRLTVLHDRDRSGSFLDVHDRATHLGLGSVLENLALATGAMGLQGAWELLPDPDDPTCIAHLHLQPGGARVPVDRLVASIPNRVTNRRIAVRRPLEEAHRRRMTAEAERCGARIHWVETPDELDEMAAILGRGERLRMLSRTLHGEMMHELRWTAREVEDTRDGIDIATLELTPADFAGMQVIRSWPVMRVVGAVGGGRGLERPARRAIAASSAVGLLSVEGADTAAFLLAGRAMQRLWLSATADGVALQPMTPLTYLLHRLDHADGTGLSRTERAELRALQGLLTALFPAAAGRSLPMLFRVGYAPPPTARALRRPVADVLRVGGS